jgi:hypothetical protein
MPLSRTLLPPSGRVLKKSLNLAKSSGS